MKTETFIQLRRVIQSATSFAEKVDLLEQVGLSKGRAIWFAHKNSPQGFNAYMQRKWQGKHGAVVHQTL